MTITGHGLKDAEIAAAHAPPTIEVDADPDAIASASAARQR